MRLFFTLHEYLGHLETRRDALEIVLGANWRTARVTLSATAMIAALDSENELEAFLLLKPDLTSLLTSGMHMSAQWFSTFHGPLLRLLGALSGFDIAMPRNSRNKADGPYTRNPLDTFLSIDIILSRHYSRAETDNASVQFCPLVRTPSRIFVHLRKQVTNWPI